MTGQGGRRIHGVPKGAVGLALGATAVAALLRLHDLGAMGLWSDEATIWLWVKGSLGDLFGYLRADVQPPLYYLAVWVCTRVGGFGEASLRFVSYLTGVCTVPLLAWCLWPLFPSKGKWGAGLSSVFLALSPFHIHYSQEAKSYAMLLFLVVGAVGCLLRTEAPASRHRVWAWSGYAVGMTAAMGTHMTALFVVPAAVLWAATRGTGGKRLLFRRVFLTLLPLAFFSPWIVYTWRLVTNASDALSWARDLFVDQLPWQPALSLTAWSPGTAAPVRNLMHIWAPGGKPGEMHAEGLLLVSMGMALSLGLAGFSLVRYRPAATRLLLFSSVPLICMLAASAFRVVYLVGRTDILGLPFFLGACSLGVVAVAKRSRILSVALALAWIALVCVPVRSYLRDDYRSSERALLHVVATEMDKGDHLVMVGLRYPTALYYLEGPGRPSGAFGPVRVHVFPEELERHPGWEDLSLYDADTLKEEAERKVGEFEGQAVFLFHAGALPEQVFERALTKNRGRGKVLLDYGMKVVQFPPTKETR